MKDLSSHIMDIAQNSVRAEATLIEIHIEENPSDDTLTIMIRDNGCGMDQETLNKVEDPFFTSRTVRKVGLGIPLLKQNAERTGGQFSIYSQVGQGTTTNACFTLSHIDRPPLGDIGATIAMLAAANPGIRIIYRHKTGHGAYTFDTDEINKILDGIPIDNPEIFPALQGMIEEELKEIRADKQKSKQL